MGYGHDEEGFLDVYHDPDDDDDGPGFLDVYHGPDHVDVVEYLDG